MIDRAVQVDVRARFGLPYACVAVLAALVARARKDGPDAWLIWRELEPVVGYEGEICHDSISHGLKTLVSRRYADSEPIGDRGRRRWRATRLGVLLLQGVPGVEGSASERAA